jgi:hypothetical protein
MSKFDDVLGRQLPSKIARAKYLYEFDDEEFESSDDFDYDYDDSDERECCTEDEKDSWGVESECGTGCEDAEDDWCDDCDDDEDDYSSDADFGYDDRSYPEDLDVDGVDNTADEPREIKDIGPDGEQRIDDTMDTVGTSILLSDELSPEEVDEFTESVDADILVAEGYLTEKTIVKMDKKAKRAQLYEVALYKVAREHNDKNYWKLQTVYKMERQLKAKLRARYHSEANRKVKEYLARAQKSKSGILSKIATKLKKKTK